MASEKEKGLDYYTQLAGQKLGSTESLTQEINSNPYQDNVSMYWFGLPIQEERERYANLVEILESIDDETSVEEKKEVNPFRKQLEHDFSWLNDAHLELLSETLPKQDKIYGSDGKRYFSLSNLVGKFHRMETHKGKLNKSLVERFLIESNGVQIGESLLPYTAKNKKKVYVELNHFMQIYVVFLDENVEKIARQPINPIEFREWRQKYPDEIPSIDMSLIED